MALQDNLVENLLDTQKKVLDSVVESTKKFTGNNTMINETIEKGNDWYKNLLETQKAAFNKVTGQAEKATETTKENATKVNEFYEQWYSTQMNWAKQIFELGQQSVKNMGNTQNNANPFAQWQN
jgi:methyl-accepting chemotaxis protein